MPDPGRLGPEEAGPWVRTCCKDGWLERGWFCRWRGRDKLSGAKAGVRGIYGFRFRWPVHIRSHCVCGHEIPALQGKYVSCPSCYWVLTRQLVRHFLEQFGPWSHIHESIFIFLMEDFDPRRPTRRCTGGRPLRSSFELTGRIEEPEHPNARGQRRRREEVDEVSWM